MIYLWVKIAVVTCLQKVVPEMEFSRLCGALKSGRESVDFDKYVWVKRLTVARTKKTGPMVMHNFTNTSMLKKSELFALSTFIAFPGKKKRGINNKAKWA